MAVLSPRFSILYNKTEVEIKLLLCEDIYTRLRLKQMRVYLTEIKTKTCLTNLKCVLYLFRCTKFCSKVREAKYM